jgi:nucleoside-diphosphate-sugar epimerase
VTGGLGFIGSNLALSLARAGADVTVVDACYPRHGANPWNLAAPGGELVRRVTADLSDVSARDAAEGIELVFNLAGQVSHVDSMTDPLFDLEVNTRSQLAFLEALRWASPGATVVFTSTRQLFGKPRYLPVDEEHPVAPVDVNGISKHAAEQLHLLYGEQHGLRASVVRLTNVFGPRQRLRDDFQGFLPIFIRRALLGQPISLFADLIVGAAGSGSVETVPWPPDRDAIDIGSYFGDSSKAKRVLGWSPEITFADGIERTVAFYREHLSRYL